MQFQCPIVLFREYVNNRQIIYAHTGTQHTESDSFSEILLMFFQGLSMGDCRTAGILYLEKQKLKPPPLRRPAR